MGIGMCGDGILFFHPMDESGHYVEQLLFQIVADQIGGRVDCHGHLLSGRRHCGQDHGSGTRFVPALVDGGPFGLSRGHVGKLCHFQSTHPTLSTGQYGHVTEEIFGQAHGIMDHPRSRRKCRQGPVDE